VNANPITLTDPQGLNPATAAGAGIGTLILPGPGTVVGAIVGTGIGIGIGYWITRPDGDDAGEPMAAGGRGERGATGGTSGQSSANPYKHCRIDPTNPNFIICKHHQTGKDVRKPKPADWPKEKTTCP
jgi:hypothetical protein